jgi:hypothetical protein
MIPTPSPLLVHPSESDWIVSVTHSGGIVSKFRVAPGAISEESAANRALRAGKIPLERVTDLTVCRAAEHVRVVAGDYETQLRALLARGKGQP